MSKPGSWWPARDLEYIPNCPVCGKADRRLLHAGLTDRVFGVAPGKWDLYLCNSCESGWLDPRPTVASIGVAYASYYTHEVGDHPIVRRKGLVRAFLHDCMNDYRNTRYGLARLPANRLGRWLIYLLPSIRAAVDSQCRHLPPMPEKGGRVLDVGFGNGGFLRIASEAGWEAQGIDFDPRAVELAAAAGLNVREGGVEQLSGMPDEHFDVITLCHVIEHVHQPVQLISELFRLLKPGGILWLDTPNLSSYGHLRFGRHWRDLDPPRHLVLLNIESLHQMLNTAGFVKIMQCWRGLSVFDVLPVSEALASGGDPNKASRNGKPRLNDLIVEFRQMLFKREREFLTFIAEKPENQ